jgi:hypothetical protein
LPVLPATIKPLLIGGLRGLALGVQLTLGLCQALAPRLRICQLGGQLIPTPVAKPRVLLAIDPLGVGQQLLSDRAIRPVRTQTRIGA